MASDAVESEAAQQARRLVRRPPRQIFILAYGPFADSARRQLEEKAKVAEKSTESLVAKMKAVSAFLLPLAGSHPPAPTVNLCST
jgi:hypothetical protein